MDTMRGNFDSLGESEGYDPVEQSNDRSIPPAAIGQDERRMQVRAYNHWASLLEDRNFPSTDDLALEELPDFGPYSVLLDFSRGIEDPGVAWLGETLAAECDIDTTTLRTLADVPSRSLLSRITDHYLQIIANQAPIGFEAEFVNQRGSTILYRGILLPYSSDDDTIDFIHGVINWKELPDAQSSDELLLEIDQALEPRLDPLPEPAPHRADDAPLTDWADGPGATPANDFGDEDAAGYAVETGDAGLPRPSFGFADDDDEDEDEEGYGDEGYGGDDEQETDTGLEDDGEDEDGESSYGSLLKMPLDLTAAANRPSPIDLSVEFPLDDEIAEIAVPELDPADMGLGDWLAAARELAQAASNSEDRTRSALYGAIGRAYDFSLAAVEAPGEFDELLADAGLTMQDRAPMTPVVKLVFGAEYDKTRLTEYAAALTHAHRLGLPRGALGDFLGQAEGGLKGVVQAERRLRKEEAGKAVEAADAPRQALAKKLRALPPQDFTAIAADGSEFALLMIRRTETGEIVLLGEVPDDVALLERAARRLIA